MGEGEGMEPDDVRKALYAEEGLRLVDHCLILGGELEALSGQRDTFKSPHPHLLHRTVAWRVAQPLSSSNGMQLNE